MRHVFRTMGTVASLDCADTTVRSAVEAVFGDADARFSLYRPDSELSHIVQGSLRLPDASDEVREMYAEALLWSSRTGGAFSPNRPDGVIDLNGVVKAAAMRAAGAVLEAAGCRDWSLSVGGDILVSGTSPDGPWCTGIIDPADRAALLCAVSMTGNRRAIATSGSAERGDHIWLGGSTAPAAFVQVTVVAADIVTADVLATAIVAGGRSMLDEVTDRWDVDVLAVARAGEILASPGIRLALAV